MTDPLTVNAPANSVPMTELNAAFEKLRGRESRRSVEADRRPQRPFAETDPALVERHSPFVGDGSMIQIKAVAVAKNMLGSPLSFSAQARGRFSRRLTSPRISHPSGSADAVAPAAVGIADGELVVGVGVEADIGVHPHAQATAQLQAVGLLQ